MTREEALQAIKEKMDYYESDKRLRGAIETLVPELRESEDERIIKLIRSLLENVRNVQSNTSLYKQYDDALAWLEKQKETIHISENGMLAWLKKQEEEEGYGAIPVESTLEYKLGFKAGKESEKQKEQDNEEGDFTIYHPQKNGDGNYECIPFSFYGSLTAFSNDKDLMDFLNECFYDKEECERWCEVENKPELPECKHKIKKDSYIDYLCESSNDEKQKEQKPVKVGENAYFDPNTEMWFIKEEQKPVSNPKWAELTWKDINELERIINNVHYEFQNGIGEDSFGELVLERFKEYKDDGSMDEQKPAECERQPEFKEVEYDFRGEKVKVMRPFFRDDKGREFSTTGQDTDLTWSVLREWCEIKGITPFDLYPRAEWSEEDEKMLSKIIKHFDWYDSDRFNAEDCKEAQDFLKSLRPQPKQEWSEDDERRRDGIIQWLREYQKEFNPKYDSLSIESIESLIDWLKSLRPQSKDEIYKEKNEAFKLGKHQLAIKFMNYLDENRPEGKMGLSNGECEDIDKAFKENDWAKIMRYAEKYLSHWKPSEEQIHAIIEALKYLPNNKDEWMVLNTLVDVFKKLI